MFLVELMPTLSQMKSLLETLTRYAVKMRMSVSVFRFVFLFSASLSLAASPGNSRPPTILPGK